MLLWQKIKALTVAIGLVILTSIGFILGKKSQQAKTLKEDLKRAKAEQKERAERFQQAQAIDKNTSLQNSRITHSSVVDDLNGMFHNSRNKHSK